MVTGLIYLKIQLFEPICAEIRRNGAKLLIVNSQTTDSYFPFEYRSAILMVKNQLDK